MPSPISSLLVVLFWISAGLMWYTHKASMTWKIKKGVNHEFKVSSRNFHIMFHGQCGKLNNTPTICGWFIPHIYGDFGEDLSLGLPHWPWVYFAIEGIPPLIAKYWSKINPCSMVNPMMVVSHIPLYTTIIGDTTINAGLNILKFGPWWWHDLSGPAGPHDHRLDDPQGEYKPYASNIIAIS